MACLEQDMGRIDNAITRHKTIEHWRHLTAVHFHADGPRVQGLDNDEHQVAVRDRAIGIIVIMGTFLSDETLHLGTFLITHGMTFYHRLV